MKRSFILSLALVAMIVSALSAAGSRRRCFPILVADTGDPVVIDPYNCRDFDGGMPPSGNPPPTPPTPPAPPPPPPPPPPQPSPTPPIDPQVTELLAIAMDNGAPRGQYRIEAWYDPYRKTVEDGELTPLKP